MTDEAINDRAVEKHDEARECTCEPYSQDAGGGYVELLAEWDPDCPVHGEGVAS